MSSAGTSLRIAGTYEAAAGYGVVTVNGQVLSPARSQRVWNHSPDGFAWGYAGSGPAQLALALLLKAGLSNRRAVKLHQRFKAAFLQRLPRASFEMDVDVATWAAEQEQYAAAEGGH